ncbi:MMPL family transporter [Protofrankia symbiont of Coriaria ruscifolia]|uniref:MMPL family transporter n=1 Tax=Protofrankia symbiont of Coriaria ruscifolia TaxID=1306542 RepID=UPI0010415198|nr:MMPL family transporter [Protofrankia symbiont of Coriaria ruscifolia]
MDKVWKAAAWPAGPRLKWVLLLVWIIVAAVASPLAIKLSEAQKNDASSFLPSQAESTRLFEAQKLLPGGDAVPAIIVFVRDPELTPADRTVVEALGHRLEGFSERPVGMPIPSPKGNTLLLAVSLAQSADIVEFTNKVKEIRRIVRDAAPPGLQTSITGPAGLLTDTFDVFSGVETTLLFVTAGVVAIILLIVYRSPFLWLVPLLTVAVADQTATGLVYLAAEYGGLTVNGQSAGILRVLVFGAGTDYALLLIARYREELTRHDDTHAAMRVAIRRAGPAIVASAATVIISMLCLLLGELNSDRGLGPVGAIGIAAALVTMMTLLPAALVVCGRRLFWPFIPRYGMDTHEESGFWSRVGTIIAARPRTIWVAATLVLTGLAFATMHLNTGLRQDQGFTKTVDSVVGQELVQRSFPAGTTSPTYVIANAATADEVHSAITRNPGVATVVESGRGAGLVQFLVILSQPPDTKASFDTIRQLRDAVHAIPAADALVGGNTGVNLDLRNASVHDRKAVIPVVLVVVVVILGLLLRSVVTPLLLIATVVVSFLAALGASALAYDWLFGFAGADPSLPLLGFIFLVALGIDYNIFLMTRVREESGRIGVRPGVRHGLAVTGGVITSAGVVLAATFSALFILPLVQLAEVGFLVAFGVLLDTLVVRSILVPALAIDIGSKIWWPSRLAKLPPDQPETAGTGPFKSSDNGVVAAVSPYGASGRAGKT